MYLDGDLIADVSIQDYKENFVIKRLSSFETSSDGVELVYEFQKGELDLRYRKTGDGEFVRYNEKRIRIHQYAGAGKYYISQIVMSTL